MALDRSLIAGLPLFEGLTAVEMDELLAGARSTRYPKDTAVFEQEAEAHSFFVLLDGHIRVVRTTPDGHQVIVRYISKGEVFGIAAALGRTTYPASAIAAVDCVALVWPNALWPQLSAKFPAFGANTYKTVGSRLQETQTRVVEMSTEQVEQRVARALLRLVNQTGRKTAWRHRNRLPDIAPGHCRNDRHDAAHGQPPAERLGGKRDRYERSPEGDNRRRAPADGAVRRPGKAMI